MSLADNIFPTLDSEELSALFWQLDAQQVELFYKSYQKWQLQQRSTRLQESLVSLEQQIVDNQVLLQLTQPSAIALATLTRLQSLGVEDVDLLDSMLERGDTWLDHTLQLLEECERLDVIHGNYTEWCWHALEDAYNWLDSMHDSDQQPQSVAMETNVEATEALLLQKLMSEDETVETASTCSSQDIEMPEEHNISVSTENIPIPSILSYAVAIETSISDAGQLQANIPSTSTDDARPQAEGQKSPKYGLISRLLARAWKT